MDGKIYDNFRPTCRTAFLYNPVVDPLLYINLSSHLDLFQHLSSVCVVTCLIVGL